MILDYNGCLYPIEFKCKTSISRQDLRGLKAFRESYPNAKMAPGVIIYTGDHALEVSENYFAIPWNSYTP